MSNYIWFPYTQMATADEPIQIERAEMEWLYTSDGKKILDGVSSWWVNVHGHCHPHIVKEVQKQSAKLEQVIFAGFTHPGAEKASKRLLDFLPDSHKRVFFTDDGSTAVEVGLKMALQYQVNKSGKHGKVLALEHAYHGDTFGAMSVSGRSIFTRPFQELLFEVDFLPSPGEAGEAEVMRSLDSLLKENQYCCLLVEPLVQGSGGMIMYSPELLDKIVKKCRDAGIVIIFDEVMTGFGRTGTCFAADQCEYKPDITCMSKGITGGFLPVGVTSCTGEIFDSFLSNDRHKTLFHGHSFTGNAISIAAINACLDLFEMPETWEKVRTLSEWQKNGVKRITNHPRAQNVRSTGTILALEVKNEGENSYLNPLGPRIFKFFMDKGILLRPLGNTIYFMPPYCIGEKEVTWVHDEILNALSTVES